MVIALVLITVVPAASVVKLVRFALPPTIPLNAVMPEEFTVKALVPSTVDAKLTLPPVKVLFAVKLTASPKL